jgi:N,N'-diacetyllegionaminate synthase
VKQIEVIAEVANAHQGKPELALELAQKSVEAGGDAVKFQIYFANELLVRNHPRYEHFKKQSFSQDAWRKLLSETKRLGVNVYADVFGLDALKVAAESDLDGFKVHSSDLSNTKLLHELAHQNKKVFLATGGSTILEIKYALEHIDEFNGPAEIVLLHGFQAYPTTSEDAILARLGKLRELFGDTVSLGYADHISPDDKFSVILPLMAIPYEIGYIEKHVTLDRAAKGVDYYSSCEPADLKEFIKDLRLAEKTIGQDPLAFSDAERHYRRTVKKQWTVQRDIPKGQDIRDEDIIMRRTGESADVPLYENIIGKPITETIRQDEWISKYHLRHKVLAVVVARFESSAGKSCHGYKRPACNCPLV